MTKIGVPREWFVLVAMMLIYCPPVITIIMVLGRIQDQKQNYNLDRGDYADDSIYQYIFLS